MDEPDNGRDAILRRLEDERVIRNILAKVSHQADRGTIDGYLALWSADGEWEGTADSARGHDAMRARVEDYRARGVQGPGSGTWHVSTTRFVEFVNADTALSESYFIYVTSVDGEPQPTRVGRYVDELHRVDGQWRLQKRRIVLTD